VSERSAGRPNEKEPKPAPEPAAPRTPYPVEHPGISDQPGSEPDYLPGKPVEDLPRM
jgi:hypothetical protein